MFVTVLQKYEENGNYSSSIFRYSSAKVFFLFSLSSKALSS